MNVRLSLSSHKEKTYPVPTPPAEAAHDTINYVRPEVKVGYFNDQGAHGFQRNVSKVRLSCGTNHDMVAVIRCQGHTFNFGF